MKHLFGLLAGGAAAVLLTSCGNYLYSDVKTEEIFRQIPSAAPRDHAINTLQFDYQIKDSPDLKSLTVFLKEDGRMNLTYAGTKKNSFEIRMKDHKAVRYDVDSKVFTELTDPDTLAALDFFYDVNFKGIEPLARKISLVSRDPQRPDSDTPSSYLFAIETKKDYHIKDLHVYVDAVKHYVVRMNYERVEEGREIPVSNSYREIVLKDNIAVPKKVVSNFMGMTYTLELQEFRSNGKLPDSLFELSAPKDGASAGDKK